MDQVKGNVEIRSKIPSVHMPETCERSEEYLNCNFCTLSFTLQDDYILHSNPPVNSFPAAENKPLSFTCPGCENEFTSYKGMRQHYGKVHKLERKAKCKLCNKKFKDNYAVKFHKKQVHEKSTQRLCVLCGKTCYNKHTYLSHFKKCSDRFFNNELVGLDNN